MGHHADITHITYLGTSRTPPSLEEGACVYRCPESTENDHRNGWVVR